MKKEVVAYKSSKSPISEQFRTLRTNIQFMNVDKKMKSLLVTSIFPNEGKSWVSSNLAVTFAQAGKKVILVDSDMRKGRQYAIFGVSPKPGLSNFLSQAEVDDNGKITEDISKYIQPTEVNNLSIITAGDIPPNPSELLVSAQMVRLLDELKKEADIVIIDGTPSEIVTDSVILSRLADSTVIVTAHKITKKDALDRVIKNINNVGGNIAGVILNKIPVSSKKYESRYYYYGRDTSESKSKKSNKKARVEVAKKTRNIKEKINNLTNNEKEESQKQNDDIQELTENEMIQNDQAVNEHQTETATVNQQENVNTYQTNNNVSENNLNQTTTNINQQEETTQNLNYIQQNNSTSQYSNTNQPNNTNNTTNQYSNSYQQNQTTSQNWNNEKENNVINTDNQDDAKEALEQTNLILQQINNYLNKEKNGQ